MPRRRPRPLARRPPAGAAPWPSAASSTAAGGETRPGGKRRRHVRCSSASPRSCPIRSCGGASGTQMHGVKRTQTAHHEEDLSGRAPPVLALGVPPPAAGRRLLLLRPLFLRLDSPRLRASRATGGASAEGSAGIAPSRCSSFMGTFRPYGLVDRKSVV